MADSTLTAIRNKVRLLTRSPSQAQLSDGALDEYVNTFIQYDFPEHLRLISTRLQFTWYCQPFVDTYETDTSVVPTTNPLYNFQNKYETIDAPIYIAGYNSLFSQSREQFFGIYPMVRSIQSIGTVGDGITSNFQGVIPSQQTNIPGNVTTFIPMLQHQVLFDSIDINSNGLSLIDIPVTNATGNLVVPGTTLPIQGTINYLTGAFNITFPTPPAVGAPINAQIVPYQPSLPQALLWYENKFTLRPVPDQPYAINLEVYARPIQLIATSQSPQLEQWWQYISIGASKKIFEDRMDLESVSLIMPEFKKQELLVLRTTIVQQSSQRTSTIYTDDTAGWYGPGWSQGGGNF